MNKTIFNLALGNIKNNKKHYIIVSLIIFMVSACMFSYIFIQKNLDPVKKTYAIETYGSWYVRVKNIDENIIDSVEEYANHFQDDGIVYGYIKHQGMYKDYQVANIDQNIKKLCAIQIVKGDAMKNDHQIVISQTLSQKEKLSIGDHLTIHEKTYQIVGICFTNNVGLPDIYTHDESYKNIDFYANMKFDDSIAFPVKGIDGGYDYLKYQINEKGYDQNPQNAKIYDAMTTLSYFFEIIVIALFILMALTSSSLKKRIKEMSLLRGIGMTSRQLVLMICFENMIVSMVSIILGFLISLLVTFGYLSYQKTIYHSFQYVIDIKTSIVILLIIILCVFFASMIPIVSSSKHALTGNFDAQKFQYIQVRYKNLKKQTLSYLALRELKVNKKINICYFILVVVLGLYGLIYFYQGHPISFQKNDHDILAIYSQNKDDIQVFQDYFSGDTFCYQVFDLDDESYEYAGFKSGNSIALIEDSQMSSAVQIKGRLPQNSHEVLVVETIKEGYILQEDYPNIDFEQCYTNHMITIHHKDYQITGAAYESLENGEEKISLLNIRLPAAKCGDKIVLRGEEYTITGILEGDENGLFYINAGVFFLKDAFKDTELLFLRYEGIYSYSSKEYAKVRSFMEKNDDIKLYTSYEDDFKGIFDDLYIQGEYLAAIIGVMLIMSILFNYNQIENNYQDYQLYHILGMSYQEIKKKQLWKAIHMFIFSSIPLVLYPFILIISSVDHYFPIGQVALILCSILCFYLIMYMIPLYMVLNNKMKQELRIGDE